MATSSLYGRKLSGGAWLVRTKLSNSSGALYDRKSLYFSDYDSSEKSMEDDYLWGPSSPATFLAAWARQSNNTLGFGIHVT